MQDVDFPSILACNIDRIKLSAFMEVGAYEHSEMRDYLVKKYFTGFNQNYSNENSEKIARWNSQINDIDIYRGGVQEKSEFLISMRYLDKYLSWNEFSEDNERYLGPTGSLTDMGNCVKAHMKRMTPTVFNINNLKDFYIGDHFPVKHGMANSFSVLYDIEKFNYGYNSEDGAGLRFTITDYAIKQMLQFSSTFAEPGKHTLLKVEPSIVDISEFALESLKPSERKCYSSHETNLTFFPESYGFKYDRITCLMNELAVEIMWKCKCYPKVKNMVLQFMIIYDTLCMLTCLSTFITIFFLLDRN